MKVISIAAVAKNGVIGSDLKLPWEIPEDMKFFRDQTRDHIVIMGRKTLEALGKPLPKRENAVITRDRAFKMDGVKVFHSLEDSLQFYKTNLNDVNKTIFIIGGAEIYKLAYPFLDEIWLTEIDEEVLGNIYYPDYCDGKLNRKEFTLKEKRPQTDQASRYRYSFMRYGRI